MFVIIIGGGGVAAAVVFIIVVFVVRIGITVAVVDCNRWFRLC